MVIMTENVELLSPCGNFDCVKAAVNAGADAVYLGGRSFGARAYASNFDNAELEQVCDLCHCYGVRVYVTVNTLYKDGEFAELIPFIDALYTMGVDGLIMQDLGAIRLVRTCWPDLPVHASTQLTANSLEDVKALEALGLTTAVLSRELNLKEIAYIAANTSLRIETFIHGALCVSYSGQCLMSSVLGNRSGNRGKCAQNCRLNYELTEGHRITAAGRLLSTKDICTLQLLPELVNAGAASLKIEGRMKSPEYVAGVTGIYRKYLDLISAGAPYRVGQQDILTLQQLFNRGAFSEGYLRTHSGMDMMCPNHPKHWGVPAGKVLSYDRKNQLAAIRFGKDMVPGDGIEIRTKDEEGVGSYLNKGAESGQTLRISIRGDIQANQAVYQTYDKRLMDALKPRYETVTRKVPLEAMAVLHADEPMTLELTAGGVTVCAGGEVPAAAMNQPLTAESVSAQIGKLGGTIFEAEKISTDLESGLYLNKSSLNSLKNSAANLLKEKLISLKKRSGIMQEPEPVLPVVWEGERSLSVCVRTAEQFECALSHPSVSVIYPEMNDTLIKRIDSFVKSAHNLNKTIAVKLPRIWRKYIQDNTSGSLKRCLESGIDGFLISSPGHYYALKDSGKKIFLDHTGNVLNSRSYAFWKSLGAESIGLSVEMSRDEINALPDTSRAELLAYGRIPLMITHQCPIGNFAGNKRHSIHCAERGRPEEYMLRCGGDLFRLDTDCKNCVCTIETAAPIDIADSMNSFKVKTFRLNFSDEKPEKTEEILRKIERLLASGESDPSPASAGIYAKSVL